MDKSLHRSDSHVGRAGLRLAAWPFLSVESIDCPTHGADGIWTFCCGGESSLQGSDGLHLPSQCASQCGTSPTRARARARARVCVCVCLSVSVSVSVSVSLFVCVLCVRARGRESLDTAVPTEAQDGP